MSRPEHIAPPEIFYGPDEAEKYTSNSRIATIQAEMALRALELLNLPSGISCYILDIGCGSGLSGEILTEEGHEWAGIDISPSMLDVAHERDCEGDLFLQDAGQGIGYRPGVFDGAISISALQWLCNADKTINSPKARLQRFFETLYSALRRGARAIFQFYPENDDQIKLITNVATRCGFEGGLLIDYPNSKKAKKYYLCLFAGQVVNGGRNEMPQALGEGSDIEPVSEAVFAARKARGQEEKRRKKNGSRKPLKNSKEWIQKKKETARARGNNIKEDSKYSGRRRKVQF